MIESGTNYSFLIKAQAPLSFRKVKAVSDQFVNNLVEEQRHTLFEELKQGVNLLETEPSMAAYLYSFGNIHEARVRRAFLHFSRAFWDSEIELIDYGCGQAVAEMVYKDYLQEKNIQQKIKRITLIDPSEICLRRAALNCQMFYPDTEIRTICKFINQLDTEDIQTEDNVVKLHLFTNLTTLDSESMSHLENVIQFNSYGFNQFVCISPFYGLSSERTEQLDAFVALMAPDFRFVFSEDLDANQLVPEKTWNCSLRVFSVENSRKKKGASLKNGKYWVDDNGVKYTLDKSTLIHFSNSFAGEYILPNEVSGIEEAAFKGNEFFSGIYADSNYYKSVDGVLYSSDMSCIVKFPPGKERTRFVLPESVRVVAPFAFSGCNKLEYIILPNQLEVISFGAFQGCSKLKNITIPEYVTNIQGSAFASCTALETVFFNATQCGSMENLVADRQGVFQEKALAFDGCTNLTNILIGSNVVVIPDFSFSFNEKVRSLFLPNSVRSIGKEAFSYSKNLESITLPGSIDVVGEDAFYWCNQLNRLIVPKKMKKHFLSFEALREYDSSIEESGVAENERKTVPIQPTKPLIEKPNKGKLSKSNQVLTGYVDDKDFPMEEDVWEAPPLEQKEEKISEPAALEFSAIPEPNVFADGSLADMNDVIVNEQPAVEPEVIIDVPVESEAIQQLKKIAEQGNVKAQNKLGYMYETGKETKQDEIEAVKWYQKAALQGYTIAQYNLGNHYLQGKGVDQSDIDAFKWYKEAADQGLLNAMNNLGMMYATGRGIEKDDVLAITWYQKAALKGDRNAIENLHRRGIVV